MKTAIVDLSVDVLASTIKSHLHCGDNAATKAEQHYRKAGALLIELKKATPAGEDWSDFVKAKVGIGQSRAYELMALAEGRKTLDEIRKASGERVARSRRCFLTVIGQAERAARLPDNFEALANRAALAEAAGRAARAWLDVANKLSGKMH